MIYIILIFLIKEKIINKSLSNIKLIFVSDLNEFSPYLLAYEFRIEQIKNLHEYHLLFQAYIFFYCGKISWKEYAYLDSKTKITVVNEVSIINDNGKDINGIINIQDTSKLCNSYGNEFFSWKKCAL